MKLFVQRWRALLLSAAAVGAVGFGCGDNGANSEGNDTADGESLYDYVTIGGKKWMKKNLNEAASDSWCYGDADSNCVKYGRLYTWSAAVSACQSVGWRLPTDEDWDNLVAAADGISTAGSKLKSKSGWNHNGNGSDNYKFSALPGGYRDRDGNFSDAGDIGCWWAATESNSGAYYREMYYYGNLAGYDYHGDKSRAHSVRCIAD